MDKYCGKCGGVLGEAAAFCAGCGSPVNAPAANPEPRDPTPNDPAPAQPAAPVQATASATPPPPPVVSPPGGYGPPPAPPAAGNQFAQFSGEMNSGAPVARTRGPGKMLSVIIMAAIVVAVGIGVVTLNYIMKPSLGGMKSTWATVIVNAAGEREVGSMLLDLNHRGEGTATFTGHPELAQPLTAISKKGKLELAGTEITMTGKVEEIKDEVDIQGKFKIDGRKGEWAALMQETAAYYDTPTTPGTEQQNPATPATPEPQQQEGVKTDATLSDLVGEWEGTIQFTRFEGLEAAQEAGIEFTPEQLSEIKDGIHFCALEIKPNGEWRLDLDIAVLGGLDIRSNVARDDSGVSYTPPEMILTPSDGRFRMAFSEEIEEDNMSGTMALDGAVIEEGELRIDGHLLFEVDAGYAVVAMEGDYSVTRTEGE